MFQLKSLVLSFLIGLFVSGPALAQGCLNSSCGRNEAAAGGDDIWPWVVVDLWRNIEGIWTAENTSEREYYRFEIKQRYSDGVLAVKVEMLSGPQQDQVVESYMSLGDVRNRDLRTVVKMYGKSYFLRVKAYDRSRLQCFGMNCGGLSNENIVLGLVMTSRHGNENDKHLRLLRKISDIRN